MSTIGETMSSTPSTGPLRHEHVLDLSTSVAGMYCAKLLGDLGAEVVRIDAPGASGITAEYLYFNTSKRSVVLDLRSADSLPIVHRLLARYDIVIADGPEESLQRRGLGFEQLREHAPALILGAVSGFGSSGPYSNFRTSHLVLCALSSWAETCGDPAGEPLQTGGEMAATVAGAYAAVGVLGAVLGRTAHGHGDFVDVAALEAAITCALSPLIYEYRGDLMSRHLADNSGPSFNVRCKDGFVGVNALTEAQWENMCAFIGRFDFLDDPRLTDASSRTVHAAEIRAAIEEALADRSA
ncbi:MAG: hypothetical protein JWM12_3206, partial [Ilumatobacteraceae bacterium]|nr:hypothetical protein [Ilumatobacteraceae bacterium]